MAGYFNRCALALLACSVSFLFAAQALGQDATAVEDHSADVSTDQRLQNDTAQASRPQIDGSADVEAEPASATVIAVVGKTDWAAAGTSPLVEGGWTAIRIGDLLPGGTLVRTGLRSSVNLQFGETTTVSVRSASFASIDQFYRSATTERVRVGLGYGTVRGGSTEGTIRGDVAVDTPVATLAKRGTEGWQIAVEAGTGRFTISLADHGLVEAIAKSRGSRIASRTVRPGEYATKANIANMWIEQDIFDRRVWFLDPNALTDAEAEFAAQNNRGYAALGTGTEATAFSGRQSGAFVRSQMFTRTISSGLPPGFTFSGPVVRPEGNFGTAASFKSSAVPGKRFSR